MKYDRMRVERLISAWRSASFHLQRLAKVPSSEFIRDADKIASAKYNFIMAIESAIDVGQHLIAKNKLRVPEDYADTFTVLWEAGIIPEESLSGFREIARFKNRLVHIYWDVDDLVIHEILRDHTKDLSVLLDVLCRTLGIEG
jgi:uncharacterized protein YutE (UPF0331/DUF86 family)